MKYIVTGRMKAGTADPEKTSTARQRHEKHVSAVKNNHATTKELSEAAFVPRLFKENQRDKLLIPRVEAGSNTSTVALLLVGDDEKGTQCLGVKLGHPVRGGYKYGDLALQVGVVSNLRQ
jgi:hypothetical protein